MRRYEKHNDIAALFMDMVKEVIIADIIDVSRFRNSKHFASYLRGAPRVEGSNDKTVIKSIRQLR